MDPEKAAGEGVEELDTSAWTAAEDLEKREEDDGVAEAARQKTRDILDACEEKDLDRLRTLAEAKGGFMTDELRRKACSSP